MINSNLKGADNIKTLQTLIDELNESRNLDLHAEFHDYSNCSNCIARVLKGTEQLLIVETSNMSTTEKLMIQKLGDLYNV